AARDGGRLSSALVSGASAGERAGGGDPIAEALDMLIRDGVVRARDAVYAVPPQRRAELDFYRNNVIHHFIAHAIIAAAMRARPAASELERDARWLSRLLKLEFNYRVGTPFEAIFSETFSAMQRLGLAGEGGSGSGVAFLAR